ncbi:hypothetical protein PR002_g29623 [Phytophthora rubi]|uniref:Uncharacterized protein n=1 Tax=Phytophthora rubi TaxID=129364 RepID=A0A6A3GZT5_9STRA|nr:hypothetical protein PR002_g29623 [Phytophthora rubi]
MLAPRPAAAALPGSMKPRDQQQQHCRGRGKPRLEAG